MCESCLSDGASSTGVRTEDVVGSQCGDSLLADATEELEEHEPVLSSLGFHQQVVRHAAAQRLVRNAGLLERVLQEHIKAVQRRLAVQKALHAQDQRVLVRPGGGLGRVWRGHVLLAKGRYSANCFKYYAGSSRPVGLGAGAHGEAAERLEHGEEVAAGHQRGQPRREGPSPRTGVVAGVIALRP